MDATTAQPTLLSAARNFIRKSAGTAVIVIAPLAALTTAHEAKGQVIMSVPTGISGFFVSGSGRSSGYSGFFSNQMPQLNNITGFREGVNAAISFNSGAGTSALGNASISFGTGFYSGLISGGTNIPVPYSFTFSGTGSVDVDSWGLYLSIGGDDQLIAGGSSLGTFTGTSYGYVLGSDTTDSYAYLHLDFFYINANGFNNDTLQVIMDSSTQGIAVNATALTAVPEPSTYAGLFGLGALGLALARRWRRTIVA